MKHERNGEGTHLQRDLNVLRYEDAASVLPLRLRKQALAVPSAQKALAEEFRLRAGWPMTILLPWGEESLETVVEPEELETLCDLATEFSRYAAVETLREGYLSVRGGFRVGLCGSAVMKDGINTNLKQFSSAAVRIAREKKGIGQELLPQLVQGGQFLSTLILSPPGGGKTTLLRDLIRLLSENGHRVGLVDERGEIAVMYRGEPQMDVGPHTDVLDACPKALGIPMLLRGMNPQIIAVDEITVQEDLQAVTQAVGCGTALLATVHASNVADLQEKPLYRQLLETRCFRLAVRICCSGGERQYTVESLP